MFDNLKYEQIGYVSYGCDGQDEYILITNEDNNFYDLKDIKLWSKAMYCYDLRGLNFCNSISIQRVEHSDNKVICTVHHRLDI